MKAGRPPGAGTAAPLPRWFVPWPRVAAGVLGFGVLVRVYGDIFLARVFPPPRPPRDTLAAWAMAAIFALFAGVALLSLMALMQAWWHRRRLRLGPPEARREGAFVALEGRVRALSGTLRAPFSGEECLAYDYEVRCYPPVGASFAGVAGLELAPLEVAGAHGRAALLGWPGLERGFELRSRDPEREPECAARVRRLLAERDFQRVRLRDLGRLLGGLSDLQAQPPPLRRDWCFDERVFTRLPGRVAVRERLLRVGAPVVLSGLWSQELGGVYGRVGQVGLELAEGDLAGQRARLLAEPTGRAALACVMALVLNGALGLLWRSDEELAARHRAAVLQRFERAWQERDLVAFKAALAAGADPNRRDHYGDTLLMNAARERDPAWVQALLAAGADVEATNPRWGRLYTALAGAALRGRGDVTALLRAAGAQDFRVTAEQGRPLAGDGGAPLAAVRDYYAAIAAGDRAALERRRLDALDPSPIDWELWRRVRPLGEARASGFVGLQAATLLLRGPDAAGHERRWAYHLVRAPGDDWRVAFEWETRNPP